MVYTNKVNLFKKEMSLWIMGNLNLEVVRCRESVGLSVRIRLLALKTPCFVVAKFNKGDFSWKSQKTSLKTL